MILNKKYRYYIMLVIASLIGENIADKEDIDFVSIEFNWISYIFHKYIDLTKGMVYREGE